MIVSESLVICVFSKLKIFKLGVSYYVISISILLLVICVEFKDKFTNLLNDALVSNILMNK